MSQNDSLWLSFASVLTLTFVNFGSHQEGCRSSSCSAPSSITTANRMPLCLQTSHPVVQLSAHVFLHYQNMIDLWWESYYIHLYVTGA